jgi:urea transport system substrate-binding protein
MRHARLWIFLVIVLLLVVGAAIWQLQRQQQQPVRIGILHSLTGTMGLHERPLVDALNLAIEEINQSGGILGRRVEAIVADCHSDAVFCGQEAERLITEEKVSALFGCWTSTCRKAVKPVVEKHDHLLFYPLQYEGMEQSPNIIYLGAAPNQQLIPAVRWALDNLGKRFYLVGNDSVFSRTANLVMKDIIKAQGGQVLGQRYLPENGKNVDPAIADILRLKPEVVINTINGDANVTFFTALAESGLTARLVPVLSTSIAEIGVAAMPPGTMAGHYAVWNYFQSEPGEANRNFVAAIKRRYGAGAMTNDPMEISYVGLHLWKQAAQAAGSVDPDKVNRTILKQSIGAPEGVVAVSRRERHLWRSVHIGRVRADGQFDILWSSSKPIRPEPYPTYRSIAKWQVLLEQAGLR